MMQVRPKFRSKWALLWGMLIVGFLLLAYPIAAYAVQPPPDKEIGVPRLPLHVKVGVHLLGLENLDLQKGTYLMDFYLFLSCEKPCATDSFELTNGRVRVLKKLNDDSRFKIYRVVAELRANMDLRDYPFDRLKLFFAIEDEVRTESELVYDIDIHGSAIDPDFIVTGWNLVGSIHPEVMTHEYVTLDEKYSRYSVHVHLQRPITSALLKGLLPAVFIISAAFFALFIGPEKLVPRLSIITSTFLGSVVFHLNMTSAIPPVGYLTFADRFMMINYVAALIALGATIGLTHLLDRKKEAAVARLHYLVSRGIPVLWIGLHTINILQSGL